MEQQEAGGGSPGQVLLLRCAWCERIKVGDAWIAPTEVPVAEHVYADIEGQSHGICPDCHAMLGPL